MYYKITTTLKTFKYRYPFAFAMDKIREHMRNCRVYLELRRPERELAITNDLTIPYLRTVTDMNFAGQIDETISNDWFI